MSIGIWQMVIVLAIVLLLFGRGKIPELMGDVAKGIKNFKNGLSDEDKTETADADDFAKTVEHSAEDVVTETKSKAKS